MRAGGPFPACPHCGALARPNILMFGDGDWDSCRTESQLQRFGHWADGFSGGENPVRLVVIECGAGTAVPSVRNACEAMTRQFKGTLVRINPREPEVPSGQVGLALNAREALEAIDAMIGKGQYE